MRVQDIMTTNVEACSPESDLGAAATIMWKRDCGSVPIVNDERKVVGMITDRDICMAVATRNKRASEIKVKEVISGNVYACAPDDRVRDALETMQSAQMRRLPVVDAGGVLHGILSINDIIIHSDKGRSKKHISHREVMTTLKALCEHRDSGTNQDAALTSEEEAVSAALI